MNKLVTGMCIAVLSSGTYAAGYVGLGAGEAEPDITNFDSDTGFELYGGFEISDSFDIEVSYVDFGEPDDGIPPVWTLSGDAIGVSAKGNLPLSDQFELFGRAGFQMWDYEVDQDGFGTFFSDDGTDLFYGVGLLYEFSGGFGLGARLTRYEIDDFELDHMTLNAQFSF